MPETLKHHAESRELSENCEIVVCIPVAGHQEGSNIYRTLASYTNQTLARDRFEINLYVNKPKQDPAGNPIEWDQTFDEIERFRADFPDIQVVVETEEFGPGEFTIGKVRHHQAKKVLQRSVARDEAEREIILVSNDADNKGVSPHYLENFLKQFENHPETSAFLGQIDWNPEEYVKHPLAHIGTRFYQYLGIQSRAKGNYIDSSGANFAIKGSVYAGLNGHRKDLAKGEDSDLGERLKDLYGPNAIGFAGNRTSLVYTSARRAVDAVLKGKAPIEQWDDNFGAFDDEVRTLHQAESASIDFENPDSVQAFMEQVEIILNRTIAKVLKVNEPWGMTADHEIFRRALAWLGVDQYDIIDGRSIRIINANTLLKGLRNYQTAGPLIQAAKTGNNDSAQALIGTRRKNLETDIKNKLNSISLKVNVEEQHPVTAEEILASPELFEVEGVTFSTNQKFVLKQGSDGLPKIILGVDQHRRLVVGKKINPEHEFWFRKNTGAVSEESAEEAMLGEKSPGAAIRKVSDESGETYLVYEKAKSDLLHLFRQGVAFSPEQSLKLIMQLLENLMMLQDKGILHGDLCPTNILIDYDGNVGLSDLECSPRHNHAGKFHKPYGGGSREIFPPELINLENPLSPSVDTYSLLSILYRLLKGRYPHEIRGISELKLNATQLNIIFSALHREEAIDFSDIPPGLARIMEKGLSPQQSERYDSAAELFNALGKFLINTKTSDGSFLKIAAE